MSSALETPNARANSTTLVSVAVVGGGVAGLAAAGALCSSSTSSSSKQKVLLLEAREELGGRVRQLRGIAPWPVEMGPEFIHGERSSVVKILRDAGCSLREYEWPDRWFFDDERVLRRAAAEGDEGAATTTTSGSADDRDRDVALVQKLFASVAEEAEKAPSTAVDISAAEWMTKRGLGTKRQRDVAEACFANDFGAPLDELGLRELAVENAEWDVGDAYYVPDAPLSELVRALGSRVPRECVRSGWPVSKVEVIEREKSESGDASLFSALGSPSKLVRLTGPRGEVVVARRVVVAVPLAVLKASLLPSSRSKDRPPSAIDFSPPLSPRKLAAVERLRVGNAIKVVLSFSRPFWPSDFFDAVCPGCFVPEFWVKAPPARKHFVESDGRRPSPFVVTGFLCGRFAEAAQALGEDETVRRALGQLDEMFRDGGSPTPATDALVSSRVVDWSRDPWALGAYSFPSLGALAGDREALARPEGGGGGAGGDVLFFAGEATHEAVNPCLQAAIETGVRAAREVREGEEREERVGGGGAARSRL